MLIVLSILLILCGAVFLLSAIIMGTNIRRARTPRGKKLLFRRCRNTAVLTLVFLAGGITMLVLTLRPMGQVKAIAGDAGYDLAGTYKTTLSAAGAEKAYLYLPSSVYAADGEISVRNERNEWFVYEETENSDGQRTMNWINRGKKTLRYQTASLSGERVLTVQLDQNGRLYLNGTFPYMVYDVDREDYEGKLADHVTDFFCSGNTLFYLTDKNELYALGFNEYGQMGDSSNRHKVQPVLVKQDITQIWCSSTHAMMVDVFGNLYAVGNNSDSQLGDGTMSNSNLPIRIMSGIRQAAVGNYFSVVLAQNGDVYTCGRTNWGQCGNGSKNGTAKPVKIGSDAIKIVATDNGAAYMTTEGKVYVWGKNTEHCFVSDDVAFLNTPTAVAENAYDLALCEGSLVILTRDRNVTVTGALRPEGKKLSETVLSMDAEVPEDYRSPVTEEEKPDISELGKE